MLSYTLGEDHVLINNTVDAGDIRSRQDTISVSRDSTEYLVINNSHLAGHRSQLCSSISHSNRVS